LKYIRFFISFLVFFNWVIFSLVHKYKTSRHVIDWNQPRHFETIIHEIKFTYSVLLYKLNHCNYHLRWPVTAKIYARLLYFLFRISGTSYVCNKCHWTSISWCCPRKACEVKIRYIIRIYICRFWRDIYKFEKYHVKILWWSLSRIFLGRFGKLKQFNNSSWSPFWIYDSINWIKITTIICRIFQYLHFWKNLPLTCWIL